MKAHVWTRHCPYCDKDYTFTNFMSRNVGSDPRTGKPWNVHTLKCARDWVQRQPKFNECKMCGGDTILFFNESLHSWMVACRKCGAVNDRGMYVEQASGNRDTVRWAQVPFKA